MPRRANKIAFHQLLVGNFVVGYCVVIACYVVDNRAADACVANRRTGVIHIEFCRVGRIANFQIRISIETGVIVAVVEVYVGVDSTRR